MAEIRAQYHIRRDADGGTRIWDVRKLIAATAHLPVLDVPLGQIAELDEAYWGGDGPMTVREVAEHAHLIGAADLTFPVLLCAEGRVMDGMHRIARAHLEGLSHVPARQFPRTPAPDFRDISLDDLPYD